MPRIYQSTQQDPGAPGHPERSGETVTILRDIHPPEIDEEVGPMHEVQFADGLTIHAFADEVTA